MNYAQLRNLDTSKLTSASTTAGSLSGSMASRGVEVSSKSEIPGGMWNGADANAASSLLSPLSNPLYDVSDSANTSQGVLEDLVAELETAKGLLDDAHDLANGHGLSIDDSGRVHAPRMTEWPSMEREREAAEAIERLIDQAVEKAQGADDAAAGALATAGQQVGNLLTQSGRALSIWDAADDYLNLNNPETADNLSKVNKWIGRGGIGLGVATSGMAQLAADWNNEDMSAAERGTRAIYRGAVEGGLSAAGGALGGAAGASLGGSAGAVVGGAVGSLGGIPGSVAGASIGAGIGATAGAMGGSYLGGQAGGALGGWAVDNSIDWVGQKGEQAWNWATK